MRAVITVIVLTSVLGAGGWLWGEQKLRSPMTVPDKPVVVAIKPGQPLASVLAEMAAAGYLDSPQLLGLWARWTGVDRQIKTGEYVLRPGLTGLEFLDVLARGEVVSYRITFPEGITLAQALQRLHDDSRLKRELAGPDDPALRDLVAPSDYVEGWFLPETYQYVAGDSDLDILRRAHVLMQQTLEAAWHGRDSATPLNGPGEALILASIVERETSVAAERPRIAGVVSRRLERNMRLQTDPTVIYGLGDGFDGNLTRQHLRDGSNPWNTYQITGLPPSPIALPGAAAVRAAVNPEPGTDLYFVAKGDGYHAFASTLEEHNANVREYQLGRKKNYRSTPKDGS